MHTRQLGTSGLEVSAIALISPSTGVITGGPRAGTTVPGAPTGQSKPAFQAAIGGRVDAAMFAAGGMYSTGKVQIPFQVFQVTDAL